jgi:hypothetical protein
MLHWQSGETREAWAMLLELEPSDLLTDLELSLVASRSNPECYIFIHAA